MYLTIGYRSSTNPVGLHFTHYSGVSIVNFEQVNVG